MKTRVILHFGSFNPVHRGHVALAEWVVEQGLCDRLVMIVSPQNPLKEASLQAPELARFEMAELACAASKYPGHIQPSAIEFLLPKPSYTIDTLRHLEDISGEEMEFSLLIGADILPQLDRWKEYRALLDRYTVWVYPRKGYAIDRYLDRIRPLEEAPLCDYSSTEVRAALERGEEAAHMLQPEVLGYIRSHNLWSPAGHIVRLDAAIAADGANAPLYVERGMWHYRRNEWGKALNDFRRALEIDPGCDEARQYTDLVNEILSFRYTDIYNP